ncbi:hypothetical protein EEW87_004350 [Janibacter melonis]|uniref:MerR family transcriptional regulator n=1 Tax=Janibacter melonis TaxID=262209 RepID=A0A5P8FKY2_9MICO|nr:hypothetical protein [Janibacter melonis]QFQ29730.1 hypothetical protein EEW87_004350 [Janibacter melonis]
MTHLFAFHEAARRLSVTAEVLHQWAELGLLHVTEDGLVLDSDVERIVRERELARLRHPSSR